MKKFFYSFCKLFQSTLPLEESQRPYYALPKELQDISILFGSRAYGGAKRYSDVDLLVHQHNTERFKAILNSNRITLKVKKSGYIFTSYEYSFYYQGHTYQISVLNSNYQHVSKAAILISLWAKHIKPLTSKKERILEQEALVLDVENNLIPKRYIDLANTHMPELLI